MATSSPLILSVNSFSADDEREELYYGYVLSQEGNVIYDRAMAKTGEQFGDSLDRINAVVNSIAQQQADAGQPIQLDVYGIIKQAMRATIIAELKLDIT